MKKPRWKEGNIVQIPLGDSLRAYGRMLRRPYYAIYKSVTDVDLGTEEILSLPILFKLAVTHDSYLSGRWEIVGHKHLEPALTQPLKFFKQDMYTGKITIYLEGGTEIPVGDENYFDLERASVWGPLHIEDRIMDTHLGKENKWTLQLAIKK